MDSERRLPARDLALIALFAGLIAALGLPGTFQMFGNAVPITAQTLGVMLAGSVLGGRRGALAVLVFLALVAAGLPLMSGGRGGLAVFAGVSAGYVIGWPIGAWITGWLTQRVLATGKYSLPIGLIANILGGIAAVYAVGIPFQAWRAGLELSEAALLALIFLPGDLIKAVVASVVAKGVHTGYPALRDEAVAHRARADS